MNIEKTISELVIEFEKMVPEKEKDLVKLFREYLKKLINSAKYSSIPHDDKDVEKVLRYVLKTYKKMSIEEIRDALTIDESFKEIQNFSRKTFVTAIQVLDGKKVDPKTITELRQELKKVKQEIEKVREENMKEAKRLLSEAILDENYVEDPSTNITSLRIWHEIEMRRRYDKNERD